jgi:hypothetical protein
MIGSLTQWHDLPMMTPAALLRRVGRIDFDELASSFFRFGAQLGKEGRPTRIMNALGQTMVMNHAVHLQIFHTDHAVALDDLAACLMGEILTAELDPFMNTGNGLAVFASFWRPLCQFGMLALHLCQCLLFRAEKVRIGDFFTGRESRERFQSNVNPHLRRRFRQPFRLDFTREAGIPLAGAALVNGKRFDRALERPMVHEFDRSHFRNDDPMIMGETETGLRERETIIAIFATKAGVPWRLTSLDAAEEGLKREVNPHSDILQDLRMDGFEGRAFSFQ